MGGISKVAKSKRSGPAQKSWSRSVSVPIRFIRGIASAPHQWASSETVSSAFRLAKPATHLHLSGARHYAFNGIFVVTAVITDQKFRYLAVFNLPDGSGGATMQKALGVEKLLMDSNLFELAPFTATPVPVAIHLNADSAASVPFLYTYGDVHVRDNYVRYLDGQFAAGLVGYAMDVKGVRDLIVMDNMIESAVSDPLRQTMGDTITYFENRTTNGELIAVQDPTTGKFREELDTPAEDAFVLACFDKP